MKKILATLSIGTLMVLAAPGIANAKGPGVTAKGKCSAASSSQIKIKTDNGRIETEFEVDDRVELRGCRRRTLGVTSGGVERLRDQVRPDRLSLDRLAAIPHDRAQERHVRRRQRATIHGGRREPLAAVVRVVDVDDLEFRC